MELKQIPTDKILANFYQPRTKFDKEKVKELAESILGNGLIQPITVRTWKDKFMIVAGERRWRAHKLAGIKNVTCIVKSYKSPIDFKIDSLVENIHRENLTPKEKGKFCLEIKKDMKAKNNEEVANILKVRNYKVGDWIDNYEINKKHAHAIPLKITGSTRTLPKEERKKIFDYTEKENKDSMFIEREFVPTYKKADEPTKKALLSGQITIEEAKKENIPEPIQLEETANDIGDDILSNLHGFKYNVDKLLKDINIQDLTKSKADKIMTSCGLHMKQFMKLVNTLRQRGAKPDKIILALVRANNGKV